MARTSPTPLYHAEDEDVRQEWTPSSFEYPALRCTCRPGVVCANDRAWPKRKHRQQAHGPGPAESLRHYAVTTGRWAGRVTVDEAGVIVDAPRTMPRMYHAYRTWGALKRTLAQRYKHLHIRAVS